MKNLASSGKIDRVLELKKKIEGELADYLKSDRRQEYSMGIFRHYPELDDEA
jgi:glutathione S-transferase